MPIYSVTARAEALAAATVETLLHLRTAATRRIKIRRVEISFDGVTASAVPVLVDLLRQSVDGTTGGSPAIVKRDPAEPAALATAHEDFTVEPATPGDIIRSWYVTPYGGLFAYDFPEDERPVIAISAAAGLRANAPAIVNATATLVFEE